MIKHVLQLKLQTGNKTKFQVAVMKKKLHFIHVV